jgi:predicted TIM-barrel fold metal-dependent hydrolase
MEDTNVIIVSADSHAGVPKQLWTEYLPEAYHDLLPDLWRDCEIYSTSIELLTAGKGISSFEEHARAHHENWHGLYDPVLRMADMDREGVAAELIYLGDSRLGDMFHNVTGRAYSFDAWEAGAKGWNRWAADAFGFAPDRFLVTGAVGPCIDMDASMAELHWIADHNFVGMYGPGYVHHAAMPPLYDRYWDPYWATCEERGIAVVVHAGYGTEFGQAFGAIEKIYNDVAAASESTEYDVLMAHANAVTDESKQFFFDFLNKNIDSRRPMWQMILGGVFDRFPGLKVVLTEIRLDWIPATLDYLDGVYDKHLDHLPAARRPSEYWPTNFLAGASFIHKAEVERRHELGVETILFGRDFPHNEGTWPHTAEYLRVAFAGVPEDELRLMLGLNGVRFLGLDETRLAEIAKRIGPSVSDITGDHDVRPEVIESFSNRGGFLKPYEGDEKLGAVEEVLTEDLAGIGVA